MAYLHCHSCDWSQDDFWSKRYNPLTKLRDDFKWLWRPQMWGMDEFIVSDLTRLTHVPVWRFRSPSGVGLQVFSWNWLILEIVKEIIIFRRQRWWTHAAWKRDQDTAVCPKCGDWNFDID